MKKLEQTGLPDGPLGDGLWHTPNGGYLTHNGNSSYFSSTVSQDVARRTVHGLLDLQPDEFYFNFLGRTGMFVFDHNDIPQTIPFQNLKIEVLENFSGFRITDEKGYIYTFSEMEITISTNSCDPHAGEFNSQNASAWYLTKVENFNGQTEFTLAYEF
jgi:hypothetical protein